MRDPQGHTPSADEAEGETASATDVFAGLEGIDVVEGELLPRARRRRRAR